MSPPLDPPSADCMDSVQSTQVICKNCLGLSMNEIAGSS